MRLAAMAEFERAGHEEPLGSRIDDIGDIGKALHSDEGDIVADIDHPQFAHHLLDGVGDEFLAG